MYLLSSSISKIPDSCMVSGETGLYRPIMIEGDTSTLVIRLSISTTERKPRRWAIERGVCPVYERTYTERFCLENFNSQPWKVDCLWKKSVENDRPARPEITMAWREMTWHYVSMKWNDVFFTWQASTSRSINDMTLIDIFMTWAWSDNVT